MAPNDTFHLLVQSYGPHDTWLPHTPSTSGWITIVLSLLALSLATRLFSGVLSPPQSTDEDGVNTVPLIPYWMPILGHIPNLWLAPNNLLDWARDTYKGGAFALNLGGTTHNFIFHPSLGTALLNQRNGAADSDRVFKHIMCATFGFPRRELDKYNTALSDLSACYKHLLSEPSLGIMVQDTISVLKGNIANFVTFSKSLVDQTQWERTSGVRLIETDGAPTVEAPLL